MNDRVSLNPGRVLVTPEDGSPAFYATLTRADNPTQEGDPLNKKTILKDATAARYGMDAKAVPDDVFAELADCASELIVYTNAGVTVTASLKGKTVSAIADSSGLAVLKIRSFGTWTVSATINGIAVATDCEIKVIAQYELALSTDLEIVNWGTIDSISKSGLASSLWSVGDKKTVNIDGTDYQFQIIGFNHDDKTDGGKAGITFQMVDCMNATAQMNSSQTNSGGWTSCAMRTSTMVTLLSRLPSALQNVIKPVNKLTTAGSQSTTIKTTSDKLFLLSELEIYGALAHAGDGEGNQYAYYKAGNSKVKKINGSATRWWMRSPNTGSNAIFCNVETNGDAISISANNMLGVSFGFCV